MHGDNGWMAMQTPAVGSSLVDGLFVGNRPLCSWGLPCWLLPVQHAHVPFQRRPAAEVDAG